VRAAEKNVPQVNIITILVDDSIYPSLQADIQWYATQYIQQEIPESKALVIPINLKNIDAPQIYKMMENIYFDGLEGVNSTLLGLILIGDIPLPVIQQEGYVFPSIYPYVDFIKQKFVRDPLEQYFVPNGNTQGQAEIWHGMINYQANIVDYHTFFQKLKTYKADPKSFIDEYVRYEDFIANKKGFLDDNLQYYQNNILFSEDIGYQRYHPLMLQLFKGTQDEGVTDIVGGLSDQMQEVGLSGLDLGFENMSLANQEGISTKIIEKSIKEGFLINYPNLFSPQNGVVMRDNVIAGGRRIKPYQDTQDASNLEAKVDSSINRINLKDTLNMGNETLQGLLINFNTLLEKTVDKKIQTEKYDMDIVVPVSYDTTQAEKVG
jgi:hypothetical protein